MKKIIFLLIFTMTCSFSFADSYKIKSSVSDKNFKEAVPCYITITFTTFYETGPVTTTYFFTEEAYDQWSCDFKAKIKAFEISAGLL